MYFSSKLLDFIYYEKGLELCVNICYNSLIMSKERNVWTHIRKIPAALGGAMIYVCMERIKEIDGGEEDDLSKY